MICFFMYHIYIAFCIVGFLHPGVQFCAIDQGRYFIQFGNIHKLPLHQVLLLVHEFLLFLFANSLCPGKGGFFGFCLQQAQLFIKLGGVLTITANDAVYDFCKEPVHKTVF